MDATLSANRKIVVINSTVGKIAKSSGLRTENTAISTITDKAMLKVNSTSSTSGADDAAPGASRADKASALICDTAPVGVTAVGVTAVGVCGTFTSFETS